MNRAPAGSVRVGYVVTAVAAVVLLARPAPAQPASARSLFMKAHFSEAIVMHDAVARGDLAAAQAQAQRLAEHRPDVRFPTGAQAFFGRMTIEAGKVRQAKTIERAASETATLLSRCGQCHEAMHVQSAIPVTPAPAVGGVVGQMLAHQRAADWLLAGLIGPSTSAWNEGARAFAQLRLDPPAMPTRQLAERARVANARAQSLSATAAKAVGRAERAQAYGRILASCARCHQQNPGVWGPQR